MRREVFGLSRFWVRVEIRGSTYHRHAHGWADAHRDHVLPHSFTQTNARVVPFRYDVGKTIIDYDLDVDLMG
jgi:hypothetical protein